MRALLVLLLGCASAAAASLARAPAAPEAEQGTSGDNNIDTRIFKEHNASATTLFDDQLKVLKKDTEDLHQTQDAVLYRTRREGSRSEAAGGGPSQKGAGGGGAGGRGRARLLVQAAPAPCARASTRLCPSEVYEFVLWPGDDRKRL